MIDVYLVDLLNFCKPDRPAQSILLNLLGQFASLFWIQYFFRVVQSTQLVIPGQDDGTRYNRSCKRGHTRLIDAGNKVISFGPKVNLKPEQEVQTLTFGTIASIASSDSTS